MDLDWMEGMAGEGGLHDERTFEIAKAAFASDSVGSFAPQRIQAWASTKGSRRQTTTTTTAFGNPSHHRPYKPIAGPYEIRVLEIKPGSPTDELHGSLHHCSVEFELVMDEDGSPATTQYALSTEDLSRPVMYTALSYTWGEPIFIGTIECDGHNRRITKSLESALRHFRHPKHSVMMWIDQLCIDQDNEQEKTQQIPLMGRIYRHAANTVIWLGESSASSQAGLVLLNDLSVRLIGLSEGSISEPDDIARSSVSPPDASSWLGLWDIVSRPWFQRLWIIQEVTLSIDAWVACGSEIIHWDRLALTCTHLQNQGISNWLQREFAHNDITEENNFPKHIHELDLTRSFFWNFQEGSGKARPGTLFGMLVTTRKARCYEPRDKVYGLLAICSPNDAKRVKISYDKSYPVQALYEDVAKLSLENNNGDLESVLGAVDGESSGTELPSWVPDWSRIRQTTLLANYYQAIYAASGPRSFTSTFSIRGSKLCAQGIIFDTLNEFTEAFEHPDLTFQNPSINNRELRSSANLVSKLHSYPGHDSVFEAFWQSLVSGKNGTGTLKSPPSFAEIFSLILDETMGQKPTLAGQSYSDRQRKPLGKGGLELASLGSRTAGKTFEEVRNAMRRAMTNRCFGITTKGYVGLFPGWCAKDDVICVLRDCSVPYLLRRETDARDFRLVGESYVHGIMQGEVLTMGSDWDDVHIE